MNTETDCKECPFFKVTNQDGSIGRCTLIKCYARTSYPCYYRCADLPEDKAEKVLHNFQKWRRGGNGKMLPPFLIGKAIDVSIRLLRKKRKTNK